MRLGLDQTRRRAEALSESTDTALKRGELGWEGVLPGAVQKLFAGQEAARALEEIAQQAIFLPAEAEQLAAEEEALFERVVLELEGAGDELAARLVGRRGASFDKLRMSAALMVSLSNHKLRMIRQAEMSEWGRSILVELAEQKDQPVLVPLLEADELGFEQPFGPAGRDPVRGPRSVLDGQLSIPPGYHEIALRPGSPGADMVL